jgi:dipeptidyl aminopeptidase/acylaminoacyl peptidase
MVLPPGYVKNGKHPGIVWLYPTFRSNHFQGTQNFRPGNLEWWQPEILAARGYVVIIPTFSYTAGEGHDLHEEVAKDTLLATQAAITAGYVNADRLGVFGESFGGAAVYSLLTQSNQFKAAVATLATADLVSRYGTFDARDRYTEDFTQWSQPLSLQQQRFYGFTSPPWEDRWKWMRNSPLSYLDRVKTPLLIAQGDLDAVPIQQGELVFTELLRRNQRVKFLRYWGEPHDFMSPANIRHLWTSVGDWFDEHLKP